jgi:hypothetical protein
MPLALKLLFLSITDILKIPVLFAGLEKNSLPLKLLL